MPLTCAAIQRTCSLWALLDPEQLPKECRRLWDRWFMMGSIGVTVALIGWALFFAIEQLASAKYHAVRCVPSPQPASLDLVEVEG